MRVSRLELYAEFGNAAGILRALIATTSSRMQLPLAAVEIRDRDRLAEALVAYGNPNQPRLSSSPC